MKVKLDENLPLLLASALKRLGHDIHTTNEEGLTGRLDVEIWQAARREGRFLLTQDLDFSDARRFVPGSHCGILLIRLHSPSQRNLTDRITQIFETADVEGWLRCFVVVTERKIRVRKPDQAAL
jgi:predicted nuclease of predicted toxin-antitoxin system